MYTAEYIQNDLKSSRRKKVILDTDTFNEIDDQYALLHLLLSADKCDILGICPAPFVCWHCDTAAEGEQQSYDEILQIMTLAEGKVSYPVLRGSQAFLSDKNTPVESDAADFIIKTSKENPEEPIYVIAIGAITNVSSALLKAPEIKENVVVLWLGCNLPEAGKNIDEYNLRGDIPAGQALFDSGAVIVLLPMAVTAGVYISQADMKALLTESPLPVCKYLLEEWCRYMDEPTPGKILWDIAGTGAVITPECCEFEIMPTPALGDDSEYIVRETDERMLMLRKINAGIIFDDLFTKIRNAAK